MKVHKAGKILYFLLILTSSLFLIIPKANTQPPPILVWIEAPTVVPTGEIFNVTIHIDNMPLLPDNNGVAGIEFIVTWDPNIIQALSMTEILFHTVVPEYDYDNCVWRLKHEVSNEEEPVSVYGMLPAHAWYAYAFLDIDYAISQGYAPITGNQTLAIITFNATGIGITSVDFVAGSLKIGDCAGEPLPRLGVGCSVTAGNPPPYITVISPQNGTIYNSHNINLIFTLSEETSWIGYTLDGDINKTINGNTTITNIADGTHYVRIYANDTTGNMGASDTVYFIVDTTPPTASFTYSPEKPEPKIVFGTFRWNVTFNATESHDSVTSIKYYIWNFGDGFNITTENPLVNHEYRKSGSYNVTLKVVDAAGNYAIKTKSIIIPEASTPLTIPYMLIVAIALPPVWLFSLRIYLKRLKKKKLESRGEGK